MGFVSDRWLDFFSLELKRKKASLSKFRFASKVTLHSLSYVLTDTQPKSISAWVHLPVVAICGLKKRFKKVRLVLF